MRVGGHDIRRRGCLFIVSGPSGAGKTSICTPVLRDMTGIELSVSYTTRKPRTGETDGVDYATQDMVIGILRDEQGHRRLFEGFLREYEFEGKA